MLWLRGAFASLPTFPWLFSCSHEGRSSESACRHRPRPTGSSCRGRRARQDGSVILAVTANAVFEIRPSPCDHRVATNGKGQCPFLKLYQCDCPLPMRWKDAWVSDFRRGHCCCYDAPEWPQLAHSAPRCPLRSSIAQQKRQALAFALRRAPR